MEEMVTSPARRSGGMADTLASKASAERRPSSNLGIGTYVADTSPGGLASLISLFMASSILASAISSTRPGVRLPGHFAESSKGRTADSESVNVGSTPSSAAKSCRS